MKTRRTKRRPAALKTLLLALGLLLPAAARAQTLFKDAFSYPDGLITDEWGHKYSANWQVTSGSLYAAAGAGWTGVPSLANNSAVFRMTTRRHDFGDTVVTFRLLNSGLTTTSRTPRQAYDGAHCWVRHQSEYSMYYASLNRRDNVVILKKKVPGGPSNGGTYYNLTPAIPYAVPYGRWQNVRVEVRNNADGSVGLKMSIDGRLLASAVDKGIGGAPIRNAGATGVRGDNANLKFDDFTVASLASASGDATPPLLSGVGSTNVTASSADIVWTTSEPADSQVEWGRSTAYGTFTPLVATMATSHRVALTGLSAGTLYYYRVRSRDAAGNLRVDSVVHGFTTKTAAAAAAR